MAGNPKPTTILERCRVSPPHPSASDVAEQTLPLTFFDVAWLHFHPIQRLLFYPFPCSEPNFLENIVPCFKKSLSQTLKHFLPLSGNLIYPLNSDKIPQIRYVPGDSVSVTIAKSNKAHDFNHLTGNNPRGADEFYAFLPDLPPPEYEPGFKLIPLLALQITLFPGAGICIGFVNNHSVGDASSIVGFIKAWSLISRLGKDDGGFLSANNLLPVYDRSMVKDPSGLADIYLNQIKQNSKIESLPVNFPTNKVRSTYILQKTDIQKLRDFVQSRNPNLIHLSPFTITTAYVWSCLARSAAIAGEDVAGDEREYFAFAVDARRRTDPPVPEAYFGNCVGLAMAECTHADLVGGAGFPVAAELIGEVISKKVKNKDEILRGAEDWLSKLGEIIGKRLFGVAGSPRFDLYDVDFGWGKPGKYESVSIDGDGSMSLCKSREFDGGLEIGLSLSKKKMDAFAGIYSMGLEI
ncbi:malonyl-coenzyme:anthocyanin 5-o-glucoside-6'''-o-malonyltransferase [Phtheirospermum japonicum]|uniref:Malonyl-coenzyme:anthocyanin 5-o-glucoside-6'''-o-malonyltransferase n=1 Tax=Phtheirospermum japonicum TaxID=374723 RepID=A0A830BBY3_9LAMI|nr:malonyl-coenzyme:anthocyanin 5-o-glucoside-6'''-o-malonyltransferase [Phtheirospermum japonicum]